MFQASLSLLRACSPHQTLTPSLISVPMASHRLALQVRLDLIIIPISLKMNRTKPNFIVSLVLKVCQCARTTLNDEYVIEYRVVKS